MCRHSPLLTPLQYQVAEPLTLCKELVLSCFAERTEWATVASLPLLCLVSCVQVLVRLVRRRRARPRTLLPSVPVVLGGRVLVLWAPVLSVPPGRGSLQWGYQFHGGWYVLSAAPLCLPAVRRVGDACASCGSLSGYSAVWCMPFGESLFEELACPPRTCWYLPPASPVSVALAQRSRCSVAGQWGRGLFFISRARRHPSAPLGPTPSASVRSDVRLLAGFYAAYPFPSSTPVGLSVCALGMLGVNCSSIEGKWGRLVAYLVVHEPDFVCLQEL